ncbi:MULTISPECIES: IS5 family transposase [Streptomyces]|uniref:IS5 family transposase n=1 Tax=Streptomyces TaxID=1883 RepID=UPI00225BC69A|nr:MULTISPECIES: IS5 family transposase [unclassified Streptomyces]MCX4650263.1 IS5 family transposase [Streptomyces sp. NBC_01446]MCX5323890.1 IS5 family transposase [Streptomyces sp. NBC_00120]MCX5327740.1 IS5 family transposase [Streptomyces sp. NBC_00120]
MTDAEWQEIRPLLPVPAWMEGRGGRPEGYCHRVMLDAVFYVVDNGIKWRNMPVDFPAWDRVYAFWRRWRQTGLITELHDRLRGKVREGAGRDPEPTAAVIDSQSVKADAVVGADSRGYDGGKKINGRRRHLICDTIGLLLQIRVLPAHVTDRQAAADMLPALRERFPTITKLWADGGYTGVLVTWALAVLQLIVTVVRRCDDLRGFRVLPRRWVVERSFGWLLRSRRLVRDYERRCDSSEAMILWSMTMLMTRRLARRP